MPIPTMTGPTAPDGTMVAQSADWRTPAAAMPSETRSVF
jgi:hypothetical protein